MKNLLSTAEEFGRIIWPLKTKLKIEGIMLYGSVARGKLNPNDLDLLIIHKNKILDKFQSIITSKNRPKNAYYLLIKLSKLLKDNKIVKILQGTSVEKAIKKNLFNTNYLNIKYFNEEKYRKKWNNQNKNPNFLSNIFSYGLLWNPKTKKYNISAKQKYQLPA